MSKYQFVGGCHCGNLSFAFDATAGLDVLGLRADMCSFCRAHGAYTTSDPSGSIRISVRNAGKLNRYQFGLKTADFLICRDCGVYIGALMEDAGKMWFTVNANSFREKPPLDFPVVPHNFDGEDVAGRIARRKTKWTPVADFRIG